MLIILRVRKEKLRSFFKIKIVVFVKKLYNVGNVVIVCDVFCYIFKCEYFLMNRKL